MAAGQLGQRGGRRGEERARRGVGQSLQHERAPLHGTAPWMVRERSLVEPISPEVLRAMQPLDRLVGVSEGGVRVRPRERDECPIALLHRRVCDRRSSLEPEAEARREPEHGIDVAAPGGRFAVSVGGELPSGIRPVVVEARLAVERGIDLAVHAFQDPDQHVLCLEVARRPDVRLVAGLRLVPGADGQCITHQSQPVFVCHVVSRTLVPGTYRRPVGTIRPTGATRNDPAERSSRAPRRSDRRTEEAEPLDRAVGRDERRRLEIGQESVLGDRRERAPGRGGGGEPSTERRSGEGVAVAVHPHAVVRRQCRASEPATRRGPARGDGARRAPDLA